ncbi:pickpocket protein 28-like isoform X2 [Folsomia candida]|uniref:pickpocket protein 28-like isoform X2 n=1 Tax=Folsomia candida TaxID=158441 RepID=UPI0016054CE4|nr:pickpocket protein 28-like isoform X2 [Folsomia candida]
MEVEGSRRSGHIRSDHDPSSNERSRHNSQRYQPHSKCCAATKLCWWDPDMDDINDTVDFTQETSLHGLKFLCQPQRHLTERIFWLIAFITSLIIAGLLISEIWIAYFNTPVVVTFQPFETTIDKIPFPAITSKFKLANSYVHYIKKYKHIILIPSLQYEQSATEAASRNDTSQYVKEAQKNIYYMEHVCSSSKSFSQKFNYSSHRGEIAAELLDKVKLKDDEDEQRDVANFLRRASQSCGEMLPLCLWQDEAINCTKLFKAIETDFGKCCVFNMIPQTLLSRYLTDDREDKTEIAEWSAWDYENDGLLIRDSEKLSRTYPRRQYRAGRSSGLSVLLNPDLDDYFCTSSDSQGFRLVKHLPLDVPHVVDFGIAIRPNSEIFMGLRPELTIADQDIRNFKLEKRNCYFRGEYQLAYFNHYTTSNCFDECLANITYSQCGCVRYYMPRDDTRDLCGAMKFNCVEGIRKSWLKTGIKVECGFCLPTCTELEYFSETTVTPIQKGIDLWIDKNNRSARWAKKNVSIVHIYFASDSSYAKERKELYSLTSLIANTGGLLGLCLGFSGLSAIELLYFYTLRAWCRTRRKKTIWAIVAMKLHRMWLRTRSDTYNNDNSQTNGSNPSFVSEHNCTGTNQNHSGSAFMEFERPRSRNSEDNVNDGESISHTSKQNPFIVIPDNSKPRWGGKFSGFGTRYSNS